MASCSSLDISSAASIDTRSIPRVSRTRTSGGIDFVQFHVDLPGDYTVEKAHDIIDRVEQELGREFPEAELLIHIDPAGHVDEPGNTLVEQDEFAKLESKP